MNKILIIIYFIMIMCPSVVAQGSIFITNNYQPDSSVFYLETCRNVINLVLPHKGCENQIHCGKYGNSFFVFSNKDTFLVTAYHVTKENKSIKRLGHDVGYQIASLNKECKPFSFVMESLDSIPISIRCYRAPSEGSKINLTIISGIARLATISDEVAEPYFKDYIPGIYQNIILIEVSPDIYHLLSEGGFSGAPILTDQNLVCGVAVGLTYFPPQFPLHDVAGKYFIRAQRLTK